MIPANFPLIKNLTVSRALQFLLLLTALVFIRVPSFDFVNLDDPSHLDNHPALTPINAQNLSTIWSKPYLKLYIPLTYTVWAIEAAFSGTQQEALSTTRTGVKKEFRFYPAIFHLGTLAFHLLNVTLVFFLLFHFSQNALASTLGAALFAFHPVQVEPVTWISALKDTLSGSFFFLSLICFLRKQPGYLVAGYFCFLLALLSKPSTIVLAPSLFLLQWLDGRDHKSNLILSLLALFLALPFAWMAAQTQSTSEMGFVILPLWDRVVLAFDSLGFYFLKLLIPFSLAIDYGRAPNETILSQSTLPFALVVATSLLTLVLYLFKKQEWKILLGLGLALLAISPVLGLKPFVFQTTSSVSDRYLYLPLFGLAFAFTTLVARIKNPKVIYGLCLLVVFWAGRSFVQTSVWQNTETLLLHTTKVNPRSWLAFNNLGSWYERNEKYDLALRYYQKSADIKPQSVAFNNIGAVLLTLNRPQEAEIAFSRGIQHNPLSSLDYNGLGFSYLQSGKIRLAKEAFEKALALNPNLLSTAHLLNQINEQERHAKKR